MRPETDQWFMMFLFAMCIVTLVCNIAFLYFLSRKGILKKNEPTGKTP